MQLVTQIIGFIVLMLMAGGVFAIGVGYLVAQLKELYTRHQYRAQKEGVHELGSRLMSHSHWFSEDERTAKLLKELGENLVRYSSYDINGLRESWRKSGLKKD